jgi:hypothetical protein
LTSAGTFADVIPNPATTTVHAVWSGGNISAYSVYDLKGRNVLSKSFDAGTKEVEFSVESFENGTDILQLETIAGTITKQFVKN